MNWCSYWCHHFIDVITVLMSSILFLSHREIRLFSSCVEGCFIRSNIVLYCIHVEQHLCSPNVVALLSKKTKIEKKIGVIIVWCDSRGIWTYSTGDHPQHSLMLWTIYSVIDQWKDCEGIIWWHAQLMPILQVSGSHTNCRYNAMWLLLYSSLISLGES